jgi:hypothetical protein
MTGPLALSPLEILFRMSPLAFIQGLIYSSLSGELSSLHRSLTFSTFLSPTTLTPLLPTRNQALALAGNGILAFALNIASFSVSRIYLQLSCVLFGLFGNRSRCRSSPNRTYSVFPRCSFPKRHTDCGMRRQTKTQAL